MKTLFLLFFMLAASAGFAQERYNKVVVCADAKGVFEALSKEYQEKPIWLGHATNSRLAVTHNEETGAWTIIEFDKDVACIIDVGQKSSIIETPNKK